jgi:broad specificity phosphatase PhoE
MALELPPGVTLYFCRHGETVDNTQGRFQGRSDTALTPRGRQQAHAMATILRREVDDPSRLDFVSSPLKRARTTMEIIREALGMPPNDFTTDARLQEIALGAWEGLTGPEARARDPELFDRRSADKWNLRVPGGGENYADVAARAESWIADLRADTFAVSHGAFTRILRGLFIGLDWKQMSELDEIQGVVFRVSSRGVDRLESDDAMPPPVLPKPPGA